jgi:hypothetical protein
LAAADYEQAYTRLENNVKLEIKSMKNIIKNTHLHPVKWLVNGAMVIALMLSMSTYSPHALAGTSDFVTEELVGCKIYNFPDPTAKVKWQGACVDGKINGAGRLMSNNIEKKVICQHIVTGAKAGLVYGLVRSTCSNGIGFDNNFVDGILDGKGSITKADGEKIETEYDNGELIRQGSQTFAASSKTKNQGVFQNGQRNGQSVQTLPNGEKRVGEFKDGDIINGIATYPDHPVSGKTKYEGEFQNGKPHGKGKFTYEFGSYYDGQGRMIRPDGDYQIGLFKEGNYVPGTGTQKETLEARKAAQKQAERDRALERKYDIRIIRVD